MAAEILIRPTLPGDAEILAANLRASDRAECEAYGLHGADITQAIRNSVRVSALCWSAFADGELGCIIGVGTISMLGGLGTPWMMGTPVLDAHHRVLVRQTPKYIDEMLKVFPHLVNFVHAKNTSSVRWLRRLGFTLHEAKPYGAIGEPFHKFEMKA